MGRSQDALGTSSEQCGSPWARFWTKAAFNALAERPGERIFVTVGMSCGSSDARSVPFLPMFLSMSHDLRVAGSSHGKTSKKHPFRARQSTPGAPWTPPGRLVKSEKPRQVGHFRPARAPRAARSSQSRPDRPSQGEPGRSAGRPGHAADAKLVSPVR